VPVERRAVGIRASGGARTEGGRPGRYRGRMAIRVALAEDSFIVREGLREVLAAQPEIEVVVLSMHATRSYILQVLQAGASAYLLKDSALEDLAAALGSVSKGGMYLSPAISTAAALKNEATGLSMKNVADVQRLTRRELQVLQLIADGKSTKEIAATLEVSVKTIETHRKQIMDKLGIRTTAGLTKYCIREGLTSL